MFQILCVFYFFNYLFYCDTKNKVPETNFHLTSVKTKVCDIND
jgi:hypothetical protein